MIFLLLFNLKIYIKIKKKSKYGMRVYEKI
jgi:hypothetical protein